MFGKPEWFKPKVFGWGLNPVTKQGWIYTGVWLGVLLLPYFGLWATQGLAFGLVWLAFAVGVLIWDVKDILSQMKKEKDDENVIQINDDDESTTLATRKYEMEIRD